MIFFDDNTALCMTGKGGLLDLDWFRPSEPCLENWIDWDEDVPIIGMIDAPESFPAGYCRFDDSFLGNGTEQAIVRR